MRPDAPSLLQSKSPYLLYLAINVSNYLIIVPWNMVICYLLHSIFTVYVFNITATAHRPDFWWNPGRRHSWRLLTARRQNGGDCAEIRRTQTVILIIVALFVCYIIRPTQQINRWKCYGCRVTILQRFIFIFTKVLIFRSIKNLHSIFSKDPLCHTPSYRSDPSWSKIVHRICSQCLRLVMCMLGQHLIWLYNSLTAVLLFKIDGTSRTY